MADDAISFVAAGVRYDVRFDDLTAADAGDFRRAVGMPLVSAFKDGNTDLDAIAGLVWLVRRRGQRGLAFASVAETLTYGNVDMAGAEDVAVVEDENSPEV